MNLTVELSEANAQDSLQNILNCVCFPELCINQHRSGMLKEFYLLKWQCFRICQFPEKCRYLCCFPKALFLLLWLSLYSLCYQPLSGRRDCVSCFRDCDWIRLINHALLPSWDWGRNSHMTQSEPMRSESPVRHFRGPHQFFSWTACQCGLVGLGDWILDLTILAQEDTEATQGNRWQTRT